MGECIEDIDLEKGMSYLDTILKFALAFDVIIAKTYFQKRGAFNHFRVELIGVR